MGSVPIYFIGREAYQFLLIYKVKIIYINRIVNII